MRNLILFLEIDILNIILQQINKRINILNKLLLNNK